MGNPFPHPISFTSRLKMKRFRKDLYYDATCVLEGVSPNPGSITTFFVAVLLRRSFAKSIASRLRLTYALLLGIECAAKRLYSTQDLSKIGVTTTMKRC